MRGVSRIFVLAAMAQIACGNPQPQELQDNRTALEDPLFAPRVFHCERTYCKRGYYEGEGYYASNFRKYSEQVFWKCVGQCRIKKKPNHGCIDPCTRASDLDGSLSIILLHMFLIVPLIIYACAQVWDGNPFCASKAWSSHQKQNAGRSAPDNFHQNQAYQQLVQKINNSRPSRQKCTLAQFTAKTRLFHDLISASDSSKHSTFKLQQNGNWISSKASVLFDEERPFVQEFRLKGSDQLGDYEGSGAVVGNEEGVKVWFMKVYEDRQQVGQTGKWADLIYESTKFNDNWIEGKWYFVGCETDKDHCGKWTLKPQDIELQYLTHSQLSQPLLS